MLVQKNNDWYFYIKMHSENIKGMVGQEINLSFCDRLNILFSKGIHVVLIGRDINERR